MNVFVRQIELGFVQEHVQLARGGSGDVGGCVLELRSVELTRPRLGLGAWSYDLKSLPSMSSVRRLLDVARVFPL